MSRHTNCVQICLPVPTGGVWAREETTVNKGQGPHQLTVTLIIDGDVIDIEEDDRGLGEGSLILGGTPGS